MSEHERVASISDTSSSTTVTNITDRHFPARQSTMSSDKDQLLAMGFESARIDCWLKLSDCHIIS
jgi:hypothetical protein